MPRAISARMQCHGIASPIRRVGHRVECRIGIVPRHAGAVRSTAQLLSYEAAFGLATPGRPSDPYPVFFGYYGDFLETLYAM